MSIKVNHSTTSNPVHINSQNTAIRAPKTEDSSLKNRTQADAENSIVDQMRSKICFIEGPNGRANGFFVNKQGLLVAPFHVLPKAESNAPYPAISSSNVTVTYNEQRYSVRFPPGVNLKRANELDLCFLELIDKIKTDCFAMLPEDILVQNGMQAYFVDFPLAEPVFNQGLISSAFSKGQTDYFTIKGAVPGTTGWPVAISHENKLYLAGMICKKVEGLSKNLKYLEEDIFVVQVEHINELLFPEDV